jgi:hypothetical protein
MVKIMQGLLLRNFALNVPVVGPRRLDIAKMAEAMMAGCFDFVSAHRADIVSACVLAEEVCLGEVSSGIGNIQRHVTEGIAADVNVDRVFGRQDRA